MCGILGSINIKFDKDTLSSIKHRGPDDFGIESFNVNSNSILLGQRRLSIIDLSPAGHQPMISNCRDYALIFNGEIYNHLDLRVKLPNDIQYRGHSDTETILHYLINFGIEGLADLNGIFAIAFLDLKKQKLHLGRDPFGVKPLYYHQENNGLVFSSEIRPLTLLIPKLDLNKDALASLLRLRYNPSPDTLYSQIKKIVPGHFHTFNLKSESLLFEKTYYAGVLPKKISGTKESIIATYGEYIENAVKRQLLSDVEVGILLSGGIDSAVIAALAKKHYPGKLKAFTIGFEGDFEEDEIEDARRTAEILGLEHHVKKITFSDFLGLIKECTRIVEEPLATTSMIPMYYLSKLASENVTVVLTGQGADEPLGGYTRYKSELFRKRIPRLFRTLIQPTIRILKIKNEKIQRGANSIGISDEIERFLAVYEIFSDEEIKNLIGTKDSLSKVYVTNFYNLLFCKSREHSVEKMMSIDTRMNLSDDLLNYTDKITMNFSIECRVPMLDLELIKYIESIPISLKLNSKEGKIIHREYAKSILPEEIINRTKKGFMSPTKKWFKDEIETVKKILLEENSEFSKIFNSENVEKILFQHLNGYNKEKQIFLLLSIHYWLENYKSKFSKTS